MISPLAPLRLLRAAYRDVADLWRFVFTPEPELACLSNDEIDDLEENDA